jgi:hypothetical protein
MSKKRLLTVMGGLVVIAIIATSVVNYLHSHKKPSVKKNSSLATVEQQAAFNKANEKAAKEKLDKQIPIDTASAESLVDADQKATMYMLIAGEYKQLKDTKNEKLYAKKAVDVEQTSQSVREQTLIYYASILALASDFDGALSLIKPLVLANPTDEQAAYQKYLAITIDAYTKKKQPDYTEFNKQCVPEYKKVCK